MHSGRRPLPQNDPLRDSNGNDSMEIEIQPFSLDRHTSSRQPISGSLSHSVQHLKIIFQCNIFQNSNNVNWSWQFHTFNDPHLKRRPLSVAVIQKTMFCLNVGPSAKKNQCLKIKVKCDLCLPYIKKTYLSQMFIKSCQAEYRQNKLDVSC